MPHAYQVHAARRRRRAARSPARSTRGHHARSPSTAILGSARSRNSHRRALAPRRCGLRSALGADPQPRGASARSRQPRPRHQPARTRPRSRHHPSRTRSRDCLRSLTGGSHRAARARARISSGRSSHKRVEPSISVNRNVTVPDGGCGITETVRPAWCSAQMPPPAKVARSDEPCQRPRHPRPRSAKLSSPNDRPTLPRLISTTPRRPERRERGFASVSDALFAVVLASADLPAITARPQP